MTKRQEIVTQNKSVFDETKSVFLDNNDWNTAQFIIKLLLDYIPDMTSAKAKIHASNIDKKGKDVIFTGRMEDCREIIININSSKERSLDGDIKPPPRAYMN